MSMTLSTCWRPSSATNGSAAGLDPWSFWANARNSVSMTSVDFPEPETPVTQVRRPIGNDTDRSRRLWPVALRRVRLRAADERRCLGTAMDLRPDRYAPVNDCGLAAISDGLPDATTRPPWTPALGPMSMT